MILITSARGEPAEFAREANSRSEAKASSRRDHHSRAKSRLFFIQLLIIPPIILMTKRNMLEQRKNAIDSAKRLVLLGKASCAVIKDNKIKQLKK